ncbi:unnamed protein product, partial [Ectocarpus fasciculatus]
MTDDAKEKETRDQVVYEMSKNSLYFQRAQKQDEKNKRKSEELLSQLSRMTPAQLETCQGTYEAVVLDLEARRDFRRICCVIDMDMFFAAVEIRDAPHLKDLPVAVGGSSMLSTSNYVARKYGVRSAMPGFIAKRLCPELVLVPCNYEKYKAASLLAQKVIMEYNSQYVHDFGLDEFYVDITDAVHSRAAAQFPTLSIDRIDLNDLRGCAEGVVSEMRRRICERTGGLTCSAGIANNFFLAKIGADQNKPDGQFTVPPDREEIITFVRSLPCRKVGGIGKVSEKCFSDLGMKTMGDIAERLPSLYHVFSAKQCHFLTRACLGIGSEEGKDQGASSSENSDETSSKYTSESQKRMSCERTFTTTADKQAMYCKLYDICMSITPKIKSKGLKPMTLTLKVKTFSFDIINRSITRDPGMEAFNDGELMFTSAKALLDQLLPLKVRLLGISVSNFFASRSAIDGPSIVSYFGTRDVVSASGNGLGHGTSETLQDSSRQGGIDHVGSELSVESFDGSKSGRSTASIDIENFICPVCCEHFGLTLGNFNDHVDQCL